MSEKLRQFVRRRARFRCEYCQLLEDPDEYSAFHLDHIIPVKQEGRTEASNLAWSCHECNGHKGVSITGLIGDRVYRLFHPRRQIWRRHFEWDQTILIGKTRTAEVTIQLLNINDPDRVQLREALLFDGRFPPEDD